MCYEQADYEAEMASAGQAEYENQYNDYLQTLLNDKQYYLFALEIIADELQSQRFKKSGLKPVDYLFQEKARLLQRKEKEKPKERIPGICIDCGGGCEPQDNWCEKCTLPF